MKKFMFILCFLCLFLLAETKVSAKIICNIGSTNGVIFSNEWLFYVEKTDDGKFNWKFKNKVTEFCPTTGCTHFNKEEEGLNEVSLNNLFNNTYFENIYSDESENGAYTDEQLKQLLLEGNCPEYIYIGDSLDKQKIGFIFSPTPINNAINIFKNSGYKTSFSLNGGSNMLEQYIEAYNDSIETMKTKLQEYEEKGWSTKYSTSCVSPGNFGEFDTNKNTVINKYDMYKKLIIELDADYDFSIGDDLRDDYINKKCGSSNNSDYNDEEVPVCEAIPDEIINYLKEALKLIRWLGLVLMIVLGTLDFVKAAASDDQDAMKKASQSFIKRLIAVIILFLLPIIIELILSILSMIGFDFAKCENYHIINF